MLKILPRSSRSNQPDAHIIVTDDMTVGDRERLAGLAVVFFGHATPDKRTYIFTEMRGTKCWLVYRHGFMAMASRNKNDRPCLTHPKDRRKYIISDAVACAKLMEQPASVSVGEETI